MSTSYLSGPSRARGQQHGPATGPMTVHKPEVPGGSNLPKDGSLRRVSRPVTHYSGSKGQWRRPVKAKGWPKGERRVVAVCFPIGDVDHGLLPLVVFYFPYA